MTWHRNILILVAFTELCLTGCVKDDLWREHFTKAYEAGEHITVSTDSIATVNTPITRATGDINIEAMPGYLTIVTSSYYANDHGDYVFKQHSGLETMHNVVARIKISQGDPANILSLDCTLSGLASRFDIAHIALMGPSAQAVAPVKISGDEGSARFRILGPGTLKQPLALHLVTTDGKEYDVEVDVTNILSRLHATPFEVSTESAIAINQGMDISTTIDAEVRVELEMIMNIDIDIQLPDPLTGAGFTAAIVNWDEHIENIDVY